MTAPLKATSAPSVRALGVAALVFAATAAPTAGDIGGCGQEAVLLDAARFFEIKQVVDCERCTECALFTRACDRACGLTRIEGSFPEGCFPLVHDGEVCVRALESASCSDYADFVADASPSIPTECDFCPVDEAGRPRSGAGEGSAR
jgi:hypothetical protein